MPNEAGYKVTVRDVHKEVLKIKDDLLPKIWDSQNDICRKLDKYNGLHEKVNRLKTEIQEDRAIVRELAETIQTTKTIEETEADVIKRISEAKEITRQTEHDKFMRILKALALIIALAGFIAAYLW